MTVTLALAVLALCLLGTSPAQAVPTTEDWAKERICSGEVADFDALLGEGLDPREARGWDAHRRLGAAFLVKLINGDLCRLPPHGVDIVGAWFSEPIDLQGANIAAQLRIEHSRFEAPVQMDRVRAEKLVSLAGSRFGAPLLMTEIGVRGSLFMGEGATFEDKLVLWGASIDGQASFFSEARELADVRPVIGATRLRRLPAPTQNQVQDEGEAAAEKRLTRFEGELDMTGIRVGRILDLRGIEAAKSVLLDRARIDGDLRLSGAKFAGLLAMDSVKVGESVEAWGLIWGDQRRNGQCISKVDPATAEWRFYYATIGANLYLSGACLLDLAVLNLSGSRIDGQLFLGSIDHYPATAWGARSILILRNTSVGKIQDVPPIRMVGSAAKTAAPPVPEPVNAPPRQSWPSRLELDGFTYGSWDGLGRQERPTGDGRLRVVPARDDPWLIAWLARDHSYTRQPYEQLARVMTQQGRSETGDTLLFTSHEIERCIAVDGLTSQGVENCTLQRSGITIPSAETPTPTASATGSTDAPAITDSTVENDADQRWDYAVLTATWLLNGYGYRPLRAVGWFGVLILFGSYLFRYHTKEGRDNSFWFALEYTFNTLLPAVSLRKEFENIYIGSPIRYYFIFLKVLGYVFVATLLQVFYQIVGRSIT